jgi:large conductance mechanosensitive channel
MSLLSEFKAFALKGNAVDLAVGVVIGGAFGKIVTALVDDVIMPIVSAVLPGEEWRELTLTPLKFKVGHLIGSVIDFLIIAAVLFLIVKKVMGMLQRGEAPPPPATRACPECLENVPIAAKRCRACTTQLSPA